MDGPDVSLHSSMVQTLALAIHEVATNARKYGALKSDNGRLTIRWHVRGAGGGRQLAIEWMEEGIVPAPAKKSPGMRGLWTHPDRAGVAHSLGARTNCQLGENQLRCTIDLPIEGRDLHQEENA
jgi:two-component system CheB/CheR fusion protein